MYGNVQTMVNYISAFVALEVGNPDITTSAAVFTWPSLLAVSAYFCKEAHLFQSDLPWEGKYHRAWGFSRH